MGSQSTCVAVDSSDRDRIRASLLDRLPTALLVLEEGGRVYYANERAANLLGGDAAKLVGAAIEAVLAPLDELRAVVARALRSGERPAISIPRPGDTPLEIGIQMEDLALEVGRPPLTAIVFQEIGHFLRIRSERDRLLKLAAVGEVLPSILHELKNPLASVTSAVELLVEEATPGPLQNELHAILTEVRRMKLGFEGIGIAGREAHADRHSAIDLALRHAVQVLLGRAERDGIEIHCDVPDLPLLPLDAAVVRAIAFNLLNNALHACRSGDSIRVSARLERGATPLFALEVADTGVGMSEETRTRCTEMFFTTKSSGSGIGLALCKSTVESAGGTLEVASRLGSGTVMSIWIPIRAGE